MLVKVGHGVKEFCHQNTYPTAQWRWTRCISVSPCLSIHLSICTWYCIHSATHMWRIHFKFGTHVEVCPAFIFIEIPKFESLLNVLNSQCLMWSHINVLGTFKLIPHLNFHYSHFILGMMVPLNGLFSTISIIFHNCRFLYIFCGSFSVADPPYIVSHMVSNHLKFTTHNAHVMKMCHLFIDICIWTF